MMSSVRGQPRPRLMVWLFLPLFYYLNDEIDTIFGTFKFGIQMYTVTYSNMLFGELTGPAPIRDRESLHISLAGSAPTIDRLAGRRGSVSCSPTSSAVAWFGDFKPTNPNQPEPINQPTTTVSNLELSQAHTENLCKSITLDLPKTICIQTRCQNKQAHWSTRIYEANRPGDQTDPSNFLVSIHKICMCDPSIWTRNRPVAVMSSFTVTQLNHPKNSPLLALLRQQENRRVLIWDGISHTHRNWWNHWEKPTYMGIPTLYPMNLDPCLPCFFVKAPSMDRCAGLSWTASKPRAAMTLAS